MNRAELEGYISETYGIAPDYPFEKDSVSAVFRHPQNRKWFALIMEIPKLKLGLHGEGNIAIVNLKCDPITIGSLRSEKGFFPAYHMSRENWISAALDGSADSEKIKLLLDVSYGLTLPKVRKRKADSKDEF